MYSRNVGRGQEAQRLNGQAMEDQTTMFVPENSESVATTRKQPFIRMKRRSGFATRGGAQDGLWNQQYLRDYR
jgi:hypothetical protein